MRPRTSPIPAVPLAFAVAVSLAVGSAGFAAPGPPETADAPTPPVRLKIASWNIAWLNRRDGQGHVPRRREDYARLGAYARRLGADVVALQEIDGCEAALRVFDPAIYRCLMTGDAENDQRAGFVVRRGLEVRPHADVAGLAVGGTRRGADIEVRVGDATLRLLAVHLKSGCHTDPLDSGREACDILRRQVPALESWIDARAREGVPFAVLGDFNRIFGRRDRLWAEIDDGDPPGVRLTDAAVGRKPECWGGRYPAFVDHIVLDRRSAAWLVRGSFEQLLFDAADARFEPVLSDHCPIAVTLRPGGAPAAGEVW